MGAGVTRPGELDPYGPKEWVNGQLVPKRPPTGGAGGTDLANLTPIDRVTQGNTAADQAARDRAEANRLATSTADRDAQMLNAEQDRLAKAGLSQAEIAARMAELTTGARLTDENDAAKSARSDASREAMLKRLPGLISSLTGEPAGGDGQRFDDGGVMVPGGGGTDPTAANAATHAAAAQKVGSIGRASLASLQDESAGRGVGLAPGGMDALMGATGQRVADVARQGTISDVDTANQMANRNYAGASTRRGQNIGVSQSILSLLGSRAY
jgi:hypothetical protein